MTDRKPKKLTQLVKEIDNLVAKGRVEASHLQIILANESDHRIATILDVHPESRLPIVHSLNIERRSRVLDLVNGHTLRIIISHLSDAEAVKLIETSPTAVSQKIVNTVERPRLAKIVPLIISDERRDNLLAGANYPQRSVGRIMQPDLVAVKQNSTVEQALQQITDFDVKNGPLYQIYVVDSQDDFVGTMPISELVRSANSRKVSDLHLHKPPSINSLTTQQKAVSLFQQYDLIEAPVVSRGKLVGRLLIDDIMDVMQQEFTADVQRFAGISGGDETMETPVLQSSRKRLPWMIVNIFLDFVAVSVIMPFQETIGQITALAVLMPIVSDMGGTSGIQSLSVSVRAMRTNKPDWKLLSKEFFRTLRIGMLNGAILGAIVGFISFVLWQNPYLGLIIMTALFLNTIVAAIVGGLLPIILRRLKKDPAMMSGSFLTTTTDFFGFLIFLTLARTFMDLLV